jgi:sugar phosphate isomerase/epimerase
MDKKVKIESPEKSTFPGSRFRKTTASTTAKLLLALTALSFIFAAPLQADKENKRLGIATYSVKGLESDIEGSFKALADAGYVVMEISNYNTGNGMVAGYKPADYAALAKKYGLEIISSHARAKFDVKDPEGTIAAWGKLFDDHKAMECKYVVFPMNFWSSTVEGLKAECDLMNKIGDEAGKRSIKFGYHNHNFEFAKIKGTDQYFLDYLIANTDPEKVFFQMDVYWVTIGGENPVAYLKKFPDRFKVLHIKDDYVIGESGTIDFKAIFMEFYKNGHKDWFVEMEDKVTPEQKKQMMAMMEGMKNRMSGTGANAPGQPPQGQQSGQNRQAPPPGAGQQQAVPVAEKLKTSLEGIKASADYLLKADFVK